MTFGSSRQLIYGIAKALGGGEPGLTGPKGRYGPDMRHYIMIWRVLPFFDIATRYRLWLIIVAYMQDSLTSGGTKA